MDVLWAVAEALTDRDRDRVVRDGVDHAVGAVAAPGGRLDAEQRERRAGHERGAGRIGAIEGDVEVQRLGIGGGDEAGRASPHRGDGGAGGVARRDDDERELLEEAAVLVGHLIADRAALRADPGAGPSFLDAYPGMRVELVLHDRNLDLVEEELDVALRIGALADSGLVARRVGEVRGIREPAGLG